MYVIGQEVRPSTTVYNTVTLGGPGTIQKERVDSDSRPPDVTTIP